MYTFGTGACAEAFRLGIIIEISTTAEAVANKRVHLLAVIISTFFG
jgi:hypothetical protein